ncbi:uncharacterized protein BXZ73DRAFT_105635 [Epithele typhae]|uniref:uncharacterized protein n=1 Tax=Epithele typhae TaxID=378194 RepID=UPI002007BB1C|nr:uncharacterized protein BXZ73DRAFT_105635 [Epithele typhae]KAH9916942.1 hypothetical protein BXZ73DRAFT_105635 [Epithele typhae]
MTEYDYSPDAVERFQAKMAGIGRWATEQKYYSSSYANPFLPSEASSSSSSSSSQPPRPRSSSRPEPHHRPREPPTRSRTLPPGASYGHGQRSRTLNYSPQPDSSAPSRGHHRSGSTPADPRRAHTLPTPVVYGHPPYGPGPSPMRATPAPNVYQATNPAYQPPPGSRTMDVKFVPGHPIVLPPPRRGEQYVIIPPKGGRVDIVTDGRHDRHHGASGSGGGRSKDSSPTKRSDPFFKRFIPGWGGDSSRSSSTRRR